MDNIDHQIIKSLHYRARMKNSELARELNIPPTTLQERIRKLEEQGIIKEYRAIIDTEKLGLSVQALIAVTLDHHESNVIRDFEREVKTITSIKACYHVSGRFDYLLHVGVKNLEELGNLVKKGITSLPDFGRCETFLIFSEISSEFSWPIHIL